MDERLKKIAKYYGKKARLEQLLKESTELIVAIGTYLREAEDSIFVDVALAIADVEVMTNQIKYLFEIEDKIEKLKDRRIDQALYFIKLKKQRRNKKELNTNG